MYEYMLAQNASLISGPRRESNLKLEDALLKLKINFEALCRLITLRSGDFDWRFQLWRINPIRDQFKQRLTDDATFIKAPSEISKAIYVCTENIPS